MIPHGAVVGGVSGKNIYIEAQGTISQGYIEGMVNVGGTPEYVLRLDATSAINEARGELNKTAASDTKTYVVKDAVNGGTNTIENRAGAAVNGRIAGNNIYLAALDININGIIQAGYDTYTATVNNSDIATLKTELANNDTEALNLRLTDSQGRYAVNDAGAVYNAKQGFCYYELPVYYDANADKLVMEPVVTGGGKVYLSGRIASTGSGRIYAANGYASIAINNNSDLPIETGKIINNERSGKITIVDTANDTRTEYTPGQTLVINNYTDLLKRYASDMTTIYSVATTEKNNLGYLDTDTGVPATTTYTPASGMRYYWAQGETTETDEIYHHEEDGYGILFTDYLFGAIISGEARDKVESWERDTTPSTKTGDGSPLDTGGFLRTGGSTDDNMNLTAESTQLSKTGPILIATDTKVKSYVVVNKYTFTADWKYIYGSKQTYTFDINASKPITVGFFGRRTGPVAINSTQSIYLNGDIEMSDGEAPLSILSRAGGVYQGASTLKTGNATIRALGDISGINIETMGRLDEEKNAYYDEIPLDIVSNGGGNIDINVIGGTTNGVGLPGDVFFDNRGIRSEATDGKRGNVTVTSTGTMRGANGVTGNTIVLKSDAGVGTSKDVPMRIDASNAVDIEANGNIYLKGPYDGALRIGSLKSEKGNVYLWKDGMYGTVEAASGYQSGVEKMDTEELIRQWVDAGVIAPTEDYEGTYLSGLKARADEYAEQIGAEYETYASGKEAYENLKTTTEKDFADYQALKGDYDTIEDGYYAYVDEQDVEFNKYLTATESIRNQLETQYKTMGTLEKQKKITTPQKKQLAELQAKFAGYDGWESYYLVNARSLIADLNEPSYLKYVGYDDIWDYILTTRPGQLMEKFTKSYDEETYTYEYYNSAEEYLATTNGYALEQKYGGYADLAAYLAADAQYRELVKAYEHPQYQSTLADKLAEAEIAQAAAEFNVNAQHFYLNDRTVK